MQALHAMSHVVESKDIKKTRRVYDCQVVGVSEAAFVGGKVSEEGQEQVRSVQDNLQN